MVKKTAMVGLSLFMTLTMACAATRLEMDYGTSARLATEQQILNAEAGNNLKPVEGLDGVMAAKALERRRSEFEENEPRQSSVILEEIYK